MGQFSPTNGVPATGHTRRIQNPGAPLKDESPIAGLNLGTTLGPSATHSSSPTSTRRFAPCSSNATASATTSTNAVLRGRTTRSTVRSGSAACAPTSK